MFPDDEKVVRLILSPPPFFPLTLKFSVSLSLWQMIFQLQLPWSAKNTSPTYWSLHPLPWHVQTAHVWKHHLNWKTKQCLIPLGGLDQGFFSQHWNGQRKCQLITMQFCYWRSSGLPIQISTLICADLVFFVFCFLKSPSLKNLRR